MGGGGAQTVSRPCAAAAAVLSGMAEAEGSASPAPVVKRVQYARFGPSSELEVVTSGVLPRRQAGQVLVENKATSVNPVDGKASISQ